MYKQFLLNSIIKEMKLVRRLSTKIPADQMNFRPQEGIRSSLELLQYLSNCGTVTIRYWYRTEDSDFRTFYHTITSDAKDIVTPVDFVAKMNEQIELVQQLFHTITDEDLLNKEVDFPWGEKATLAEGIMETCIKWLTAYKLQLFLNIKLSTEEKLTTPDLWRKLELDIA